ncbi:MAG: MFS transporter [Nitrospiraceae bacterium]
MLLGARAVRAFGDGYVSLLLPFYLKTLGFSALETGAIATATLFGSGLATLAVGQVAHRIEQRKLLMLACVLMTATGLGFAAFSDIWILMMIAVVGTLNPSSGDVSVFLPLEHARLSEAVQTQKRTAAFAAYGLVGTLVAALGALAAGLPTLLATDAQTALRAMFILYAALGLICLALYRGLSNDVVHEREAPAPALSRSKKTVYTLAALFSLDAFAGGFVVQALLALWLFERFELSVALAGTIFFWSGILSAVSYLIAVRIAGRFGLLNTMVFTHLPANVLLVLTAFAPSLPIAIAFLLARSVLSQMDVPTRSAFVMSVVAKHERAAAASVTSVPRSMASAVSPLLAGYLLSLSSFGWPLIAAGGLKIVYDLTLFKLFRSVPPLEEG